MPQVPCSFKQARPAAGAVRKAPGASSEHAAATARALVTAEAEGNPGVGLRHVFGYRDALEAGRIRGAAEPAVEVVTEAVTGVDAAEGLPHLGVERAWERSEERRVGKECVSTCRSRWSPYHYKKKNNY